MLCRILVFTAVAAAVPATSAANPYPAILSDFGLKSIAARIFGVACSLTANDYFDLSLLNSPSSLQEKILGTASSWQRVPTVAV
jgi:hypothetical protein